MRLGIFAKTFPGRDPGTVLKSVRKAGFAAAQYNMACSGLRPMPDAILPNTTRGVADAAQANEVRISAVSGTYNMAHPDPAVRADGLRRLEVIARACKAIGTDLVTLCTGTRDPHDQWRYHPDNASPEAWATMRAEMAKALNVADAHDIRLGIEPELANVVHSAPQARRLIDDLASSRLVVVLDPANLFEQATLDEQRQTVAAAIDLLADRIAMGHAKDRAPDGSFVAAGRGVLDYAHYIGCLKRAGFNGELVTHGLSADEAPGVAQFLQDLLA